MMHRFITPAELIHQALPFGHNEWLCRPGLAPAEKLLLVRHTMRPGCSHQFHRHPEMEELIYVLSGVAEQWVEQEHRLLKPGELAHIPPDVVHATYNPFAEPLTFLAVLSPATSVGPATVDVFREDPWRSLKAPVEYPAAP